jgi:hydrogenase maturation factor
VTTVFEGRVQALREDGSGRWAVLSVRGARVEVAADLVPEARVGDTVVAHAGVALGVADSGAREED